MHKLRNLDDANNLCCKENEFLFTHLERYKFWCRPSGIVVSDAVPLGLGSNPGEDMDICECIVPSLHWCTLNSRRAASSLVRLVEWEERWKAPDHPQGVLPLN
ncbi:uncharacterized protein TNCV_626781 [Trichonephila clavipes]|nr:uncharacterized protein TNCV_626781 [Trichonephila clavipes]